MTGFPVTVRLASVSPALNASPRLTSSIRYITFADQFEVFQRTKGVSVSDPPSQPVSGLLNKWRSGDQEALQALIPLAQVHAIVLCFYSETAWRARSPE